jgi:hypothetical protein
MTVSPRTRILLAVALLVALAFVAGAIGSRENRVPSFDPRRSVQLTGPLGARAYAEALKRLGVAVELYRERTAQLPAVRRSETQVFALLDPSQFLDGAQALDLVAFHQGQGDLLLAGWTTSLVMQCFGYDVDYRSDDSTPVYRPGKGGVPPAPVSWTGDLVLARILDSVVTDTTDLTAGVASECTVPEASRVDTLLLTEGGRPAALRLSFDELGSVTLVADGMLFSNARLRETEAGLAVLPMIGGRYDRVLFDEYEHGFGPGGSLLSATLDWSVRTPFGWAFWQLAIVGLLALLAGAIRFGPALHVIERRRRSPLEHVRALATALSAARGARVAVELMIRGLRRRLSAPGTPVRGDLKPWLAELAGNVRTARSRQAVNTLITLTRRAPEADSVLRAAEAVEEVWQDLKPPSPTR